MGRINKTIAGRYILKELIGQGGMADVYLAEDIILKRVVAVKIMRSSLTGDPVYVTRFHREASAAASLSHKNIVEIYDVGEDGDDYFIVMEYVPGQTLKELIHKRGALHFVEAVDIMKQVASATAKAHSMGIVHRDLKPQNIMVTDSGVVKIGDFGIASIQSLSQVTQTDTIMGSLHYLAPEIARGEKATPQSDIYALGIVFYELLRGEVPFNGESPVNIALKHMRDDIPSVRAFNSSIPQSVENVIIKATAKNIHDRYQTTSEMYEDLATCLNRDHEEKLVFTYQEEKEAATIVADDKDFFTQSQSKVIETEDEEEKTIDKKRVAIISSCVIGALALFIMIYFAFLRPSNTLSMPDVVNMQQEDAIAFLVAKGYKVNETIHKEVSDQEEGIVLESDPKANTAVKKGTEVTLTVSSGKYIVIEDYKNQSYEDVEKKLTDLGIKVKFEEEISKDFEKGKIISQSINEGEKIDPHEALQTTITFVVSKGFEVTVPNVLGVDIEKAQKILEDSGFVVTLKILTPPTTAAEIETMKINVVQKQSLDAFTVIYKYHESITLEYYDHKPEIPDVSEEPDDNPDEETETPSGE